MEKNKKLLIIGGSVGAVRSIANTLSDARRIEAVAVTEDVANGGSVAVSANLDKFAKEDITVQGKFYSDAKNLKGALELTASEDKDKVLQAKVMYNQDKVAFSAAPIVDGTYGINLKKLSKNLPGSIFDPDEETEFSLDDEAFEYFLNMKDTFKNDKNLSRDVEVMANKYRQVFIEKVIKHSDVKKAGKTITIGGDKIPCTVITASIDEDGLAEILQEMIDYANNDKDLEKLLLRVAANGSYMDDPDEYVDRFFDSLDRYEDSIDKIEDSDIDISIDFYITKSGRRLAQVDLDVGLEHPRDRAQDIPGDGELVRRVEGGDYDVVVAAEHTAEHVQAAVLILVRLDLHGDVDEILLGIHQRAQTHRAQVVAHYLRFLLVLGNTKGSGGVFPTERRDNIGFVNARYTDRRGA